MYDLVILDRNLFYTQTNSNREHMRFLLSTCADKNGFWFNPVIVTLISLKMLVVYKQRLKIDWHIIGVYFENK